MLARRWDAVAVALTKTVVSGLVLATGFRALSDDDFARIVIAERFAASPSLDPSGTSWLPFPFWLNGAVMASFGRSVEVARASAFVLGVGGAVLVFLAAQSLRMSRPAALAGAILACTLPYSAWLGVATVPEAWTAGLTLFGVATLAQDGRIRVLGALALGVACLSRYEPWAAAGVFALFSALDFAREKQPLVAVSGLLALGGPLAWMLHGALAHHDALFFVTRVSAYRRAIGAGNQGLGHALVGFPWMVVRCEPEVSLLALLGAVALAVTRRREPLRRFSRVLLALGALLAFLVAGDVRDGAPTHHAERVLLTIWLGLGLFAVDALFTVGSELERRGRLLLALGGSALVSLGAFVIRPWYAARDSFVERNAEVAIGRAARDLGGPTARLLIDAPDYGYFAVIAGFGAPERAEPVDDRDPRKVRPPDAFRSASALRARARAAGATHLVTHGEHTAIAAELGSVVREVGSLSLMKLRAD